MAVHFGKGYFQERWHLQLRILAARVAQQSARMRIRLEYTWGLALLKQMLELRGTGNAAMFPSTSALACLPDESLFFD